MTTVNRERLNTLKYIQENPQSSTDSEKVCGYIIDDLFNSELVFGYRSNELGRGPEPIYHRLQITTKGREFIEKQGLSIKLSAMIQNPYLVGITCTVIGGLILAFITMRYLAQ
ncbi:hypothetical protein [Shewanella pneumatophori]|uniref:Uncharacterized protein n=1 Tax=Shewanella pneumatophori TaxID=314092 RepID=A0A9X1ZLT9_9GAMM|nr:hypothetical protein [Shewanella pneumatophori]MCL1140263.1 hypothetical protein [Shewanella pneumatophori]